MRTLAKGACVVLLVLTLLAAALLTYSTARGYTQWWLISGGHVAVDGVRGGYLHTNWSYPFVMITRTDSKRDQSYLVRLSGSAKFSQGITYCGDWHAPRFPAFPIGDLNPPCMGVLEDPDPAEADRPLSSTLTARPGFVEFTTLQGKKVTARW
ncbi:MAG: hypothetical protein ABSD67_03915 [Terracidiphilus sp.]|jgi:hypothetical protein